jgi:hypothetical protein
MTRKIWRHTAIASQTRCGHMMSDQSDVLDRCLFSVRAGAVWSCDSIQSFQYPGHSIWRGWVSVIDSEGRTICVVDAHCDTAKRFVVRSDEMLSAFLELERIMHELALSALLGDYSN